MNELTAINEAIALINERRKSCAFNAAWDYLYRVTRHLERRQTEVFNTYFGDHA